ncbi:MAG: right-handed parallel beta-helix repeat-containing protein [Candidatus Thermoplasmatota archaeon]|nr:right-handed parallel beta-helix repeat-containing protein [Candidatus Thermoplasmatota archaeon]
MKKSLVILVALAIVCTTISMAEAQCCGEPENGSRYIDDRTHPENYTMIDRNIIINGTMVVDEDLLIENSTVTVVGKGIVISEGSNLVMKNSTLKKGRNTTGFYLDLVGDAWISNCTIDGCLDAENQFFGLYLEDSSLVAENMTMTRSGMVRVSGGNANLMDSRINGIISYSGNITLHRTVVYGSGISQIGKGRAILDGLEVFTDLPFTSTAGIYCLDAEPVSINNVSVNGTYNGGISAIRTPVDVCDVTIDLPEGIIAIELKDLDITGMRNISSSGTELGIFIHNCTSTRSISNISVDSSQRGMDLNGNDPISLEGIEMIGSRTGISVRAPTILVNSLLKDNDVGVMIEKGSMVRLEGCVFLNYSIWAIEDETWSEGTWSNNTFQGGTESYGEIAWWGWMPIEVTGPGNIRIQGTELTVDTPFGPSFKMYSDKVGLIWGYDNGESVIDQVSYGIIARWGTATRNISYVVKKDETISIEIPMTDLWVGNVSLEDNIVLIEIGCNGSDAKEVTVTLLVDGVEWNTYRTTLSAGETRIVEIQHPDLGTGDHDFSASVSSQDEYKGEMKAYLENNEASFKGTIHEHESMAEGGVLLIIACLSILSILFLIVPILLKRQD